MQAYNYRDFVGTILNEDLALENSKIRIEFGKKSNISENSAPLLVFRKAFTRVLGAWAILQAVDTYPSEYPNIEQNLFIAELSTTNMRVYVGNNLTSLSLLEIYWFVIGID